MPFSDSTGAVFQSTGNYDASFYLGGSLFLAGTMLHFVLFLPCMKSSSEDELIVEPKTVNGEQELKVFKTSKDEDHAAEV